MAEKFVKVCGLTRAEDMAFCHDLGIDYTGMIFVEKSPRFILPSCAVHMPKGQARRVGVFAGASLETIREVGQKADLDLIQLHGSEDVEFCRHVGAERVIKVLWPERLEQDELQLEIRRFAPVCTYYLFDAGMMGGGSGKTLQWSLLNRLDIPRPWFVAGGIGPVNIQDVLLNCDPSGIDMNSAVENAPGIKNLELIQQALVQLKRVEKPGRQNEMQSVCSLEKRV